jgi:hypothetical protein
MKYATVEEITESSPHPILPAVQGGTDYKTIHATGKLLQANARDIDTHLGGGYRGHLGIIVSEAEYAVIAPIHTWVTPEAPGRAPLVIDTGTAAQLSAASHTWEESVLTFRTYHSVQQSVAKQIITVFEPMYLDILNDDMVGFA